MLKAREILRLKFEVGLSLREIANSCDCGKTSVSEVLERAKKAELTWHVDLNDKQLGAVLYPPVQSKNSPPEPDVEYIFYEMKKKGVTLMLLWEEYKNKHPHGLMYTRFCEHYREFKKKNQLTMHINHKGGEEVQVDWAGQKMCYVEPSTGEIKNAYIFVAVLPVSAYPFVYAFENMKTPNWIDAHVRAYEYFGGVPKVTVPDNTKTAVIKPDLVDPILNKSYNEMAKYYITTLVPARACKPNTTLPEHMPEEHKAVSGWSSERFLSWAEKIGPYTKELLAQILDSREYEMQTYRTCMGIMRFRKSYSDNIMESASREALAKKTISYKYFSMIIKQVTINSVEKTTEKVVKHANVRGMSTYIGGGLNAK